MSRHKYTLKHLAYITDLRTDFSNNKTSLLYHAELYIIRHALTLDFKLVTVLNFPFIVSLMVTVTLHGYRHKLRMTCAVEQNNKLYRADYRADSRN